MVIQYWHLVVIVTLVALAGWGLRVARQRTLLGLAATLLLVSGFLLYTLVIEESAVENGVDDLALIGIPAVLGVGLGLLAVKHAKARRA
ncbi:hypothetical protein [Plantactinospora endophytica]|uniref:Uncharacterized protein n=1 Tax=Plantactinospora endophytica TaxID=673535 RepID=A0ABQ4E6M0_9ACTN|nr:hypothetical protein [Plantactinospora endophytica]GIG90352.1 hypothetical protein Pen02_52880 [Plantactinospora endophytica]